jgi:type II secretory pathway pseudopilin PulG
MIESTRKGRKGLRRALTLFETLVVVAVILIVTAITLPVVFRARHSAWRTDEISSLRQLALAGQLYSEMYGKFPVSTELLYDGGYGIERLVYSRRDPYPDGFVNAYIAWSNTMNAGNPQRPMRAYKATFSGVGDFWPVRPMSDYFEGGPLDAILLEYEQMTAGRENAGWLVSIGEGGGQAELGRVSLQFRKPVLRLTFGGSVVRRPGCTLQTTSGEQAFGPMPCFFDRQPGDLVD